MRYCVVCGKSEAEVGRLSVRGKCASCAEGLVLEAIQQVRAHNGPVFQRWRRNHAAAVGGIIPERPAHGEASP